MKSRRHSMRSLHPRHRLRCEVGRIRDHQLAAIGSAVVPDRQYPSVLLAGFSIAWHEYRLARIGVRPERKCLRAVLLIVALGEIGEAETGARARRCEVPVAMLEAGEAIVDA